MEKNHGKSGTPKCSKCDDTGVIETGNNDEPCACPAGDGAIFSVAGRGEVFGATLKEEREKQKKRPVED